MTEWWHGQTFECNECRIATSRNSFTGGATADGDYAVRVCLMRSEGNSVPRRILFVRGRPVVADASDRLTFTRQSDVTIVKLGDAERREIPDALVAGG